MDAQSVKPIKQTVYITAPATIAETKALKYLTPEELTPPSNEFASPTGIQAALHPISISLENAATSIPITTN